MHNHAAIAIKAAKLRRSIGRHAAIRMCQRAGVPLHLFTLACVLENAKRAGL